MAMDTMDDSQDSRTSGGRKREFEETESRADSPNRASDEERLNKRAKQNHEDAGGEEVDGLRSSSQIYTQSEEPVTASLPRMTWNKGVQTGLRTTFGAKTKKTTISKPLQPSFQDGTILLDDASPDTDINMSSMLVDDSDVVTPVSEDLTFVAEASGAGDVIPPIDSQSPSVTNVDDVSNGQAFEELHRASRKQSTVEVLPSIPATLSKHTEEPHKSHDISDNPMSYPGNLVKGHKFGDFLDIVRDDGSEALLDDDTEDDGHDSNYKPSRMLLTLCLSKTSIFRNSRLMLRSQ